MNHVKGEGRGAKGSGGRVGGREGLQRADMIRERGRGGGIVVK